MSDILTGTPPDLTYAHDLVRQAWMVVWAITSGALVVILGWMGLSFIMAEHLGTRQAGWREMVPRWCSAWWPQRRPSGGAPWSWTLPTPCPALSRSP